MAPFRFGTITVLSTPKRTRRLLWKHSLAQPLVDIHAELEMVRDGARVRVAPSVRRAAVGTLTTWYSSLAIC